MSPTQFVALLVRLFALGLVAFALRQMQWMLAAEYGPISMPLVASMALLFLGAVILWRFPTLVAGTIVKADSENGPTRAWSTDELYCCGIVTAGLFFLFWSLSDILYWLTYWWSVSQDDTAYWGLNIDWKAATVATFGELIFALSLIFGVNGWKRLIYRIRYGKRA